MNLKIIIDAAKKDLIDEFDVNDLYPEDKIHEIADSAVPIYTYELITLAADPDISFYENELPPAFSGEPTIPNIVATSVYELVSEALFELLYELQNQALEAA